MGFKVRTSKTGQDLTSGFTSRPKAEVQNIRQQKTGSSSFIGKEYQLIFGDWKRANPDHNF